MPYNEEKRISAMENTIVTTCASGASDFLKGEIEGLGLPVSSQDALSVSSAGGLREAIKINMYSRTGQRVLYFLADFPAKGPEELYRGIYGINWEDYLYPDGYFCVTSTVDNRFIRDGRYANVKCKDAIADRMVRKFGRRPDSGPERDRAVVSIYWKDEKCTVYLDTSGEALSKRGYRKIPLKAPMQESLAATVVLATGWRGGGNLINPMCGSGTIAIEAALIGLHRAPGLLRKNFGFRHIVGFDPDFWEGLRREALSAGLKGIGGRIVATDISPEAISAARANAAAAGVEEFIEFGVCDYNETEVPEGGGVVVLNPEYGERMGRKDELESTYAGIGDFFKRRCRGYTGYVFTAEPGLSKRVGLRPKRKRAFFSGGLECRLLEYELYEGSKKRAKGGGYAKGE